MASKLKGIVKRHRQAPMNAMGKLSMNGLTPDMNRKLREMREGIEKTEDRKRNFSLPMELYYVAGFVLIVTLLNWIL